MKAKTTRPGTAGDPTGRKLYWIALNGSSCAMATFSMCWPFEVKPTPEHMIGFPTEKEAYDNQQFFLNAPFDTLEGRIKELYKRHDVFMIKMTDPEPQTDGPTLWLAL